MRHCVIALYSCQNWKFQKGRNGKSKKGGNSRLEIVGKCFNKWTGEEL